MATQDRMRLLLVEDSDDETLRYLDSYRDIPDVVLFTAKTLDEGVAAVRELEPDGLILDHQLIGGSGEDLIEKISKFVRMEELPFIALTRTGTVVIENVYYQYDCCLVKNKFTDDYKENGPLLVLSEMRRYVRSARLLRERREKGKLAAAPQSGMTKRNFQLCVISGVLTRDSGKESLGDSGHAIAVEAIYIQLQEKNFLDVDLKNNLYPKLCKQFRMSPGSLSKSLQRYAKEMMGDVLNTPDSHGDKCGRTNIVRQFIGYYVRKIRQEYGL